MHGMICRRAIFQFALMTPLIWGLIACTPHTEDTDTGPSVTYEHCGNIEADETWAGDAVHVVTCDLYIEGATGPVLTIEAGAEVRVDANVGIYVAYGGEPGGLVAQGTADDPILFTAHGNPEAGAWSGIAFYDNTLNGEATLASVTVEHAGGYFLSGAVHIDQATVEISNSTIRTGAEYGLYLYTGAELSSSSIGNTITGHEAYAVQVTAEHAHTILANNDFAGNTVDGVEVLGGTVASSVTWEKLNVPYVVDGDIYVQGSTGPVLTVAPGATIQFKADKGLYIAYGGESGGLIAEGTASDPILFTANINPQPGHWSGIDFYDNSLDGQISFDHATVEYAGGYYVGAAIRVETAALSIQNSTLSHSAGYGLLLTQESGLTADSTGNTLTSNANFPLQVTPEFVKSIPAGNSFTGNGAFDGIELVGGDVVTSGTWLAHDVPYVSSGEIYIESAAGPVVTIEAGTTIQFEADQGLYVSYGNESGGLIAQGTAGNEIIFTAHVNQQAGHWSGIAFYDSALDASILDHVQVMYAGGYYLSANIAITRANITVSNSQLGFSEEHGIRIDCATPTMGGNTFNDNTLNDVQNDPC